MSWRKATPKSTAWLLTENGQKFCMVLAGAVSVGTLSLHYLPHTLLLDKYKGFLQLYHKGSPMKLPQNLEDRFQKALELVEASEFDKFLFEPFYAYGFDIVSAGYASSHNGVIVGIPNHFAYNTVQDIEKHKIQLLNSHIIWDSEPGEMLKDSLVISENGQLYAMAREIKYRQTYKVLFDTIFGTMGCLSTYGASIWMNQKFELLSRSRPLRYSIYVMVASLMFGLYITCKDVSQLFIEKRIDEELKNANPIFAEGGKEYYTKVLQRNKALRHLMGKQGEMMFTPMGNENNYLRTPHIPLVQRKEFFEGVPLQGKI